MTHGVAILMRLIALTVLVAYTTLLSAAFQRMLCRGATALGLLKTNFEGKSIVGSAGVAIGAAVVPGYLIAALLVPGSRRLALAFALVASGAGLLGLLDDFFGSRRVGGFRGHFGELAKGKVTTGALKALLIPAIALAVALLILRQPAGEAILTMALVALSANALNLLDVRPARACNAWIAASVALLLIGSRTMLWPLALTAGPVLMYRPLDASRRAMLGDVGSNLIGAILGLSIAAAAPFWVGAAIVLLLLHLHAYSERRSLSAVIDDIRWLRWLDWGTGPRD